MSGIDKDQSEGNRNKEEGSEGRMVNEREVERQR